MVHTYKRLKENVRASDSELKNPYTVPNPKCMLYFTNRVF